MLNGERLAGRLAGIAMAAVVAFGVCGCAGDFVEDPNRPRPTRAMRPQPGMGDGLSETSRDPASGVSGLNLLTVDLPNNDKESAHVHTILDPLNKGGSSGGGGGGSGTNAGAASTTVPAAQTVVEHAPDAGAVAGMPVRIVAQQRPADTITLSGDNEGNILLHVTSPSGIGTVMLERTGDIWPGVIHVMLVYPDRPFAMLEGFRATEVLADDRRVELKTTPAGGVKGTGKMDVLIPGFTRGQRIAIEWVDAYR